MELAVNTIPAASPNEEPAERNMTHRQVLGTLTWALIANCLLLGMGVYLFLVDALHYLPNSNNDSKCDQYSLTQGGAWTGGILISQVVANLVLLSPLCVDCWNGWKRHHQHYTTCVSMTMARAAAVSSSWIGLILVVLSFFQTLTNRSSPDGRILRIMGILVFMLSSASLMISFWPATTATASTEAQAATEEGIDAAFIQPVEEREGWEADNEPLLPTRDDSSTRVQSQTSGTDSKVSACDERNGDKTGNATDYQLMEGDHDEEAPLTMALLPSVVASTSEESESSTEMPTSRLRGTRRLLQLARPQVVYLYAGCLVLLIRLPFSLSIPHFVSTTLTALSQGNFHLARAEIAWLFLFGTLDAVFDFWCVFLFGYANQRIVRGVRVDLLGVLLRQDVAFFDATSSGELASRLNSDCSEMAGDLTWFFRFSIESVVRIVGITIYMLVRSPVLGACALSIVPVVGIINKFYGDWLSRNATLVQDALADANAVAQETLANVRTVIAFAAESKEEARYERKIQRQYELNIKQLYMTGVYYMAVSTFLINTIVQSSLLWIGANLIAQHRLAPEVLLAFMLYQGQLQNETLNLFRSFSSLIKSSGAGDKVFALLDRRPPAPATGSTAVQLFSTGERDDDTTTTGGPRRRSRSQANQYNVRFEQVSFRYPTRPDHLVLNHLDLEIEQGQTLALVGSSGCGKSTIVNLLQRFYDPNAGSIVVNGQDLRRLDLEAHRRHIGVVTQDPVLFDDSIWQNIVYGAPHATREDAVRAAKLAHADAFIRSFPQGYDTGVGERGVQLSGGQLQRIAIARAMVQKPSLLLLDEATSALDAASEQIVQDALDRLLEKGNMTTVVVAHRLRTVRNADQIAVIDQGKVVEKGTHVELLQLRSGLYRKMVGRAGNTGILPE